MVLRTAPGGAPRGFTVLKTYLDHVAERAALGIPPLPLSETQTHALVDLLGSGGVLGRA